MKLTSIHLRNIKCFEDFVLDLTDEDGNPLSVCVLVGANGSGKTTILKSVVSTFSIANREYQGDIFDKDVLRTGENVSSVDITFSLNEKEKQALSNYKIYNSIASEYDAVEFDSDIYESTEYDTETDIMDEESDIYGLGYFVDDSYDKDFRMGLAVPYNLEIETDLINGEEVNELTKDYAKYIYRLNRLNSNLIVYFDSFRYMTLKNPISPNFSDTIKKSKVASLSSSIGKDGILSPRYFDIKQWFFNLDFVLLKKSNEHAAKVYTHFITACNQLFGPLQFDEISEFGEIMFKDIKTNNVFTLNMLSDGFKSIFIIIAELLHRLSLAYDPKRDGDIEFYENEAVVLIDEIDCHLHPRWQVNVLPALKNLFPNCQFIVTTHSPYILKKINENSIKRIGEDPFVK